MSQQAPRLIPVIAPSMVNREDVVAEFEAAWSNLVGSRYSIALVNGTATLHTALVALGVQPGDTVSTTPLTMSSTTLAILHAGATPRYVDVDPDTWLMNRVGGLGYAVPVDLFGLRSPYAYSNQSVCDSAQTLRKTGPSAFTSYSLQQSKILNTGEGGVLCTDDVVLATKAREFSSLGYRMQPTQPRIDKSALKSPDYERHHSLGYNYRMAPVVAACGLQKIPQAKQLLADRKACADMYREAVKGCSWITPQVTPDGWQHDYWAYAVALESKELWHPFADAIVRHGGEKPYAAWRLSYHEPALEYLAPKNGCMNAENLQPRLVLFQTNNEVSAERNAAAVCHAIAEVGG